MEREEISSGCSTKHRRAARNRTRCALLLCAVVVGAVVLVSGPLDTVAPRAHPALRNLGWYLVDRDFVTKALSVHIPSSPTRLQTTMGLPAFVVVRRGDRLYEEIGSSHVGGSASREGPGPSKRGKQSTGELRDLSPMLATYAEEASRLYPLGDRLWIYRGGGTVAFFWIDHRGEIRHKWVNRA